MMGGFLVLGGKGGFWRVPEANGFFGLANDALSPDKDRNSQKFSIWRFSSAHRDDYRNRKPIR